MEDKEFFEKLADVDLEDQEEQPVKTETKAKKNNSKEEKEEKEEKELEVFEGPEGQLTVDVYQTPMNIIIESAVAGVDPENIDISVSPDAVVIKGKRHKDEIVMEKDYLYQECFWGRFSRSIILPQEVDSDKAHASIKNGIIKIILPKINRQKAKKIKVKFD
ncbi:MAG: Hsp20/alpha crystallin family protein [Patescibacteria group bacterium]